MSDMTSVDPAARKPRPLSPHLSIYKPIPTMVMSILHRITGVGLYVASILMAWWLVATAMGPGAYSVFEAVITSWFGLVVLVLLTWTLVHHMLGGLKHLVQDTGAGLEKNFTTVMAYVQIIVSIALTTLIWVVGVVVN